MDAEDSILPIVLFCFFDGKASALRNQGQLLY